MSLSQEWKTTVDDALKNKAWDEYDTLIKSEVGEYNHRLARTKNFAALLWHCVKAIVWVESGGPSSPAWKQRAMQIGNPGDPALRVLMNGAEGSSLIASSQILAEVKSGQHINTPSVNIKAGIAYLYTRLAYLEEGSIDDPRDTKVYTTVVQPGDGWDAIAKRVGSTRAVLIQMNPGVQMLQPKQVVKYRKAKLGLVITSWRPATTVTIASRYNVGDTNYAAKLEYCMKLIEKIKR